MIKNFNDKNVVPKKMSIGVHWCLCVDEDELSWREE